MGNRILSKMKLSIALTTNLACYAAVIEPSESTIRDRTIRRRETWSQNQDRKFCIQMTSSPDEDLCEHPQGDRFDWAGGPISIHQNGKIVGLMLPETEKYKLCLDYDEVDIENDVFEFAKTTNDGVCITSLIIDGTDILVGPNVEQPNFWPGFWPNGKQPNFWIDGNENSCTADFVSTQELKIQNNVVFSSECDKFCIKMTSSNSLEQQPMVFALQVSPSMEPMSLLVQIMNSPISGSTGTTTAVQMTSSLLKNSLFKITLSFHPIVIKSASK